MFCHFYICISHTVRLYGIIRTMDTEKTILFFHMFIAM